MRIRFAHEEKCNIEVEEATNTWFDDDGMNFSVFEYNGYYCCKDISREEYDRIFSNGMMRVMMRMITATDVIKKQMRHVPMRTLLKTAAKTVIPASQLKRNTQSPASGKI